METQTMFEDIQIWRWRFYGNYVRAQSLILIYLKQKFRVLTFNYLIRIGQL